MIFIILVDFKNGLVTMAGYIVNLFYVAPCAENIRSCCGAEFGPRSGASVVLNWSLYGLKTASNSFPKYFGDFLRDLVFITSRYNQDLWIRKSDYYKGYDYIETHS